jgi:hypothetical protein
MNTFTLSRGRLVAALALTLTVALTPLSTGAAFAQEQAPGNPAEPASRPRFDATPGNPSGCIEEPPFDQRVSPTSLPGYDPQTAPGSAAWQTSAPRRQQQVTWPGGTAVLSLRDKFGTGSRIVRADVYRPDGQHHRFTRWLPASEWANVSYPSDTIDVAVPSRSPNFVSPPPLVGGTYTVIWTDAATEGYIACDGFFVAS